MPSITINEKMPDFSGKIVDVEDGRLELVTVLGSGAYGTVYSAVDLDEPKSTYAVKCLRRPARDSRQHKFLEREFSLHQFVSPHPNIVTFHGVVEEDKFYFVVLDFCPGGDLFGAITQKEVYRNNPTLLKRNFVQLIDALAYCHESSTFHRDLKPENVLCSADGQNVYLADFGLATSERASKEHGCGSSFYMSPECLGVELPFGVYSTRHSDIWSLGVILVNMITGRNPWRWAKTTDDCFAAFLHEPDFLRQMLPISLDASRILKRVFHLNPLSRISLADLREEILALDTFYMTDAELAVASKMARAAAYDAVPEEEEVHEIHIAAGPAVLQEESTTLSVDPEEVYIFPSPDAGAGDAIIPIGLVPRSVDMSDFSIGSSSSSASRFLSSDSTSDDSDAESDGPITPETHPVDPATVPELIIDIPELEIDITDLAIDLDIPADTVGPASSPVIDTFRKPRTTRAGIFRSAVQRLKAL